RWSELVGAADHHGRSNLGRNRFWFRHRPFNFGDTAVWPNRAAVRFFFTRMGGRCHFSFSLCRLVLLAGLLLVGFVSQNIGGVAAVVEKQTAITVLPVLGQNEPNQISGELQSWAWFALTVIILLAIAQAFFAIKTRPWSKTRVSTVDRTEAKKRRSISGDEPLDAIAIWDSQR
ncbi:MAG: hypothetical protein WCO24_04340, partial [Actinomycetes bacterium]